MERAQESISMSVKLHYFTSYFPEINFADVFNFYISEAD